MSARKKAAYLPEVNPAVEAEIPTTGEVPDFVSAQFPLLPLNHMVGMPGDTLSFTLQHEGLVKTVRKSHEEKSQVFTYCSTLKPSSGDGAFGTLARVSELAAGENGGVKFKLLFERRAELLRAENQEETTSGTVRWWDRAITLSPAEQKAMIAEVELHLEQLRPHAPGLTAPVAEELYDLDRLIARIARALKLNQEDRFKLLEGWSYKKHFHLFLGKLGEQVQILELRRQLRDRTTNRMQKIEREAFLQEEKRLIETELGHGRARPCPPEFQDLQGRIQAFAEPAEVRGVLDREFAKLTRAGPYSPNTAISQDYLEVLLDLPWRKEAQPDRDWERVERSLAESHFGLDKVKKRILQFLAVHHLAPGSRGAILCFVGPPGVGKTSVARAMATALGLPFVKKSLGGVHDESEIRGHRRTYIGAMPGRIIQGMRKVGVLNPLFLLDEVDKLGHDHRGSPADALLEVLDPDENRRFSDHYVEVEFDLSKVFFVLTANSEAGIPEPLRDRLEIIRFSGYTEGEKIHIARHYLWRRNLEKLAVPPRPPLRENLCRAIIREYTREAGVRELDRKLAELLQHLCLEYVRAGKPANSFALSAKVLRAALGAPPFHRPVWTRSSWIPGVMAGLAWTPVGGAVLKLECFLLPGKGHLTLTGKLGEVMQESAHIALSFVKHHRRELGLGEKAFEGADLHIHIPAGAVAKEGPSAGLGLALLLCSALGKARARPFWAVTGELTLHGEVLPVGGVKEKILAAQQEKFVGVVLPKGNESDFMEIPENERGGLEFRFVSRFSEAFGWMLPGFGTKSDAAAPRKRR